MLIRGGYLAVTTFFVLSGFVLAHNYASTAWNAGSLRRYAAARFARIYPVYFLSLLVVAPFIAADRTPAKARFVAAHGLLVQAWLGHIPVNWNTPAWSLSCEMFFYLSFPLAAALLGRAGMARHAGSGGGGLLPHARALGGGRLRRDQAADPSGRFPDGDCRRARLRPAAPRSADRRAVSGSICPGAPWPPH